MKYENLSKGQPLNTGDQLTIMDTDVDNKYTIVINIYNRNNALSMLI